MKNVVKLLGIILVAALVSYAVTQRAGAPAAQVKETAFERVMRTNVLRCGYSIFQPHLSKDVNSGQIRGTGAEIIEAAATLLNWRVEWVEEAPIASIFEGLKNGRYDAICSPLYIRPNNMALVEFVGPLYYVPINAYATPDKMRHFSTREDLAKPETRLSAIDGTTPYLVAKADFPTATLVSLPEKTDYGDVILQVITGKADVVFVDSGVAGEFLKNNPGKISRIDGVSPLRVFPTAFNVMKGEQELANTLNWAVQHLHNNGQMEPMLSKYEPTPRAFMRMSPPYEKD